MSLINSLDPEELVVCPYDPVHRVARKRMQYHLIKCRKNHNPRDYATCPFNARHVIPKPEFEYHIRECPDRAKLDAEMLQQQRRDNFQLKGNTDVPASDWRMPEVDETWEDDNVVYVPPAKEGLFSGPQNDNKSPKKKESPPKPVARQPVQEPPQLRMPRMGDPGSQVYQYSLATVASQVENGSSPWPVGMGRGRGRGRGLLGMEMGPGTVGGMAMSGVSLPPPLLTQQQLPSGQVRVPFGSMGQPALEMLRTEELQKRERKLHKMLRQIQHLEEKQQKGEELDHEQVAKLGRKQDVVSQLEQLRLITGTGDQP